MTFLKKGAEKKFLLPGSTPRKPKKFLSKVGEGFKDLRET